MFLTLKCSAKKRSLYRLTGRNFENGIPPLKIGKSISNRQRKKGGTAGLNTSVGLNVQRKEAWDKVTGQAAYTDDLPVSGTLCARLCVSPVGHARILSIDTAKAEALEGVRAVVTGRDCPELFGVLLRDRPALAQGKARYAGEPVAIVVAVDEPAAQRGVGLVEVSYESLPVLLNASQALMPGAALVHEHPEQYQKEMTDLYPRAGTNVASSYRIRKGNAAAALEGCEVKISKRFSLPPSDHLAMEVRAARAEIGADGTVHITTSSQSPYAVRTQLSDALGIPAGQIQVLVPFVGGGFGGKASVMPEILAYLAARKVNGRAVRLVLSREQDMESAPCRLGLEAEVTLGADRSGQLRAAQISFYLDCGAYADISPYMAKAAAADCTGPYRIENLSCEAMCVYTNHTYATSYRSFSHESYAFCMERAMDILARELHTDPLELRLMNALRPGDLTPTRVECTRSLIGDLPACIRKLKTLSNWDGGQAAPIKPHTVKAMGAACFWKAPNPPTDAVSGALITFNSDGTLNLNTGVVEMGSGSQTHLAQILAEKLKLDASQVHVSMGVDTRLAPKHWKTVASLTLYMAGQAVVRAADDLLAQLRQNGAAVFRRSPDEIEVVGGRVFVRDNPAAYVLLKDIAEGFKAQDGSSLGEPVLGRGGFMLKGLSQLDPVTGRGKTGPAWTVGAQAVELELDTETYTYRVLSASTVMDVGKVINPAAMEAMVAGGMAMGLSMASREAFFYDDAGVPTTPNLRTYKLLHIGQEPDYRTGFVETPQQDAPYGVRSFFEHGIIGIPAALGNALAAALGKEVSRLPLTPETLWRLSGEGGV